MTRFIRFTRLCLNIVITFLFVDGGSQSPSILQMVAGVGFQPTASAL